MYVIHAPNQAYTGTVAGIKLTNGVSEPIETVPDYFKRHTGYTITQAEDPKPVQRRKKPVQKE